jgi:hypothetical protein
MAERVSSAQSTQRRRHSVISESDKRGEEEEEEEEENGDVLPLTQLSLRSRYAPLPGIGQEIPDTDSSARSQASPSPPLPSGLLLDSALASTTDRTSSPTSYPAAGTSDMEDRRRARPRPPPPQAERRRAGRLSIGKGKGSYNGGGGGDGQLDTDRLRRASRADDIQAITRSLDDDDNADQEAAQAEPRAGHGHEDDLRAGGEIEMPEPLIGTNPPPSAIPSPGRASNRPPGLEKEAQPLQVAIKAPSGSVLRLCITTRDTLAHVLTQAATQVSRLSSCLVKHSEYSVRIVSSSCRHRPRAPLPGRWPSSLQGLSRSYPRALETSIGIQIRRSERRRFAQLTRRGTHIQPISHGPFPLGLPFFQTAEGAGVVDRCLLHLHMLDA